MIAQIDNRPCMTGPFGAARRFDRRGIAP